MYSEGTTCSKASGARKKQAVAVRSGRHPRPSGPRWHGAPAGLSPPSAGTCPCPFRVGARPAPAHCRQALPTRRCRFRHHGWQHHPGQAAPCSTAQSAPRRPAAVAGTAPPTARPRFVAGSTTARRKHPTTHSEPRCRCCQPPRRPRRPYRP
eukprot:2353102-Prymnesium_polylepis.2